MSFSSRMAATSSRLLTKYGSAVTVTRTTTGTYNPASGDVISTVTTYTGVGNSDTYSKFEIDNINILNTDIKFLFYSDTAPIVNDVVSYNGVSYRVLDVGIDIAQGTNILYTLQLRQ